MKPRSGRGAVWVLAALSAAAALAAIDLKEGRALKQLGERRLAARSAQETLANWPQTPRLLGAQLIDRWGAPDSIDDDQALVWLRRDGFLKITVRREAAGERGFVQHSVRYSVPITRWQDLDALGLGVEYEPTGEVLSASAGSEGPNILALNLAVDVVEQRLTPADARAQFARTIELARAGKSSPFMRQLMFKPAQDGRQRKAGQLWPMP